VSSDVAPSARASQRSGRTSWVSFLIRVAFGLVALWLVSVTGHRHDAWQRDFAANFRSNDLLWLGWIGTANLAGFAFGLEAWLPWPIAPLGYRWGVAIASGSAPRAPTVDRQPPS
jgi:hypothetical protein